MTSDQYFRESGGRCLVGALAIFVGLLLPIRGLSQEVSVREYLDQLMSGDAKTCINAEYQLGELGAKAKSAIEALIVKLGDHRYYKPSELGTKFYHVNQYAAEALGKIGSQIVADEATTKHLVEKLKERLEDKKDTYQMRGMAAEALGQIGAPAKDAVKALYAVFDEDPLKPDHPFMCSRAASALGLIVAKVPDDALEQVLIDAFKHDNPYVRSAAVYVFGLIGATSEKTRLPQLIVKLRGEIERFDQAGKPEASANAALALTLISQGTYSTDKINIASLKELNEFSKSHPAAIVKEQADRVQPILDYIETRQRTGFGERLEKLWAWMTSHPIPAGLIVLYLFLPICWFLIFWFRPLWLLSLSALLSGQKVKLPWSIEIVLSLRHILLISLFHHRKRVLDRWVREHVGTARQNFARRPSVRKRSTYVQTTVEIDRQACTTREQILESAQPLFDEPKTTLLICGEGGAGKTSLACQMGNWAMASKPQERLCKSHLMLPVLIEFDLEPQADGKNAFTEAIRNQLGELIGRSATVSEELLLELLHKGRLLVIVDGLSERDDAMRQSLRPKADFPVASMVITSRTDKGLNDVTRTDIKLLRLKSDRLSSFMDRYLERRGMQFETDEELFESCRNLSRLIGNGDITALIAQMYAELKIAAKTQASDHDLPKNLPRLMEGYVCNINESVQADQKDTRAVLRAAKVVAWECLRKTCRPSLAKLDDVLQALSGEEDAKAMLGYLEARLQLIQTVGWGKKDAIHFSLDPLAEYLASLHLIEHDGSNSIQWRKTLADIKGQVKAQPEGHENIQEFLQALRGCCDHLGKDHSVPAWVIRKIDDILKPPPAQAASAD
ncbi:MAG TPA: NACHT domain-containing protein [Blastocatellia bacterium]|nr:NACHT domain-containing protein [Blastocatellia bacterium]